MPRKYLIAILAVLVLGILAFVYYEYRYKHFSETQRDIYAYVPLRSAMVVESSNIKELASKLESSSIIWADLINIPFWNRIHEIFLEIQKNEAFIDKVVVSAVQTSGRDFDFISVIRFSEVPSQEQIGMISQFRTLLEEEVYKDFTIYTVKGVQDTLCYFMDHNTCVVSASKALQKEVIDGLAGGKKGLVADPGFLHAYEYSGNDLDGTILVNFDRLPILFRMAINKESSSKLDALKTIGSWIALDMMVNPNYLNCNGFITLTDSVHYNLSALKYQNPVKSTIASVIPKQTVFYCSYSFSDIQRYSGALKGADAGAKPIGIEAFGAEQALVYLSAHSLADYDKAAIFSMANAEAMQQFLAGGMGSLDANQASVLEQYFGLLYADFIPKVHKIIGEHVIFAEKQEVLDVYFPENYATTALSTDINFVEFTKNFSEKSNVYMYWKPTANKMLLADYFSGKSLVFMEKYDFLFNKFESVGIQLSVENEQLVYTSIQAKYNPSTNSFPTLLWEFMPDAPIVGEPLYFLNHNNGLREVFVQDKNNTVYLISTIGKLLWKQQLQGPILGKPVVVDALKNGKYQLAFTTAEQVYVLDRNGKNLTGFPLSVPGGVSAPGLQLMDYERNKNYRLLIPSKNKKIYNYTMEGKLVEGWAFEGAQHEIVSDFKHFVVAGKDYIVCVDEKGNVYSFDRKGVKRFDLTQKVLSVDNTFSITAGSSLEKSFLTYTDNVGIIYNIYFNGKQEVFSTKKEYFAGHRFLYADLNKDNSKEYIYANGKELEVYNQGLELVYTYTLDSLVTQPLKTFDFNGNTYLGAVSGPSNHIYLLDAGGVVFDRFPLQGNTTFPIGDLDNDGVLDLAVGTQEGALRVYSLEQ